MTMHGHCKVQPAYPFYQPLHPSRIRSCPDLAVRSSNVHGDKVVADFGATLVRTTLEMSAIAEADVVATFVDVHAKLESATRKQACGAALLRTAFQWNADIVPGVPLEGRLLKTPSMQAYSDLAATLDDTMSPTSENFESSMTSEDSNLRFSSPSASNEPDKEDEPRHTEDPTLSGEDEEEVSVILASISNEPDKEDMPRHTQDATPSEDDGEEVKAILAKLQRMGSTQAVDADEVRCLRQRLMNLQLPAARHRKEGC